MFAAFKKNIEWKDFKGWKNHCMFLTLIELLNWLEYHRNQYLYCNFLPYWTIQISNIKVDGFCKYKNTNKIHVHPKFSGTSSWSIIYGVDIILQAQTYSHATYTIDGIKHLHLRKIPWILAEYQTHTFTQQR